jgi:CoA:oxalate CoA-transferase
MGAFFSDQHSETAMTAKLPMLTGYRVLDITQFVAGPTCTRILAELGAEVIKVELAPYGDRGRASGDKPRDVKFKTCSQSTYFFQHNHSKKSLAVDIKQARGRELVRAIVPKVDVLVENFTPGVMARAGLGYDELSAIHPALIMCSISLAGQTGPLSRKPGFDYVGAAYAGITSLIGEADRGPAQFATAIGDHATGVTAAMSIGFALLHRERTGEGQYIECSLIDTYFNMHEVNVPKSSLRGSSFAPTRAGSLHPDGGPTGVFRYRGEEFLAIMVMPYQWKQMIKAMNMPDWSMIRASTRRAPDATTMWHSSVSSKAGSAVFRPAVRPLRRWKRSVCPARRFSPCTRPWPIRICASAEPSGG